MKETSRDTSLPETLVPRDAKPELAAGGLTFRIHLSGWEAVLVSYRLRTQSANKRREGWTGTRMVGAKRTRRAIAVVAGQESASLQLRERCKAQHPPRCDRWASCERAELLARWGRLERAELRSEEPLPRRPRFGRKEPAPPLFRKSRQVQP